MINEYRNWKMKKIINSAYDDFSMATNLQNDAITLEESNCDKKTIKKLYKQACPLYVKSHYKYLKAKDIAVKLKENQTAFDCLNIAGEAVIRQGHIKQKMQQEKQDKKAEAKENRKLFAKKTNTNVR